MGCFVIAIFVTSQIIDKLQLKSYGVAVGKADFNKTQQLKHVALYWYMR